MHKEGLISVQLPLISVQNLHVCRIMLCECVVTTVYICNLAQSRRFERKLHHILEHTAEVSVLSSFLEILFPESVIREGGGVKDTRKWTV